MRRLLWAVLLSWPVLATAKVVNFEINFSAFVGDTKADEVDGVAGTARVFVNGVPHVERPVEGGKMPVMFEARDVGPSLWLPTASLGPALRHGKNTIRIEFAPTDPKTTYRAQLRWASVMDEATEEREPGRMKATNQANEGVEEKEVTGTVTMQREFTADFATDQPWHHYPAITTLSDDDKRALAAMVAAKAEGFKPNFAAVYTALAAKPGVDVAAARKHKCFEAAYAAGVRISAPASDALDIVTTGQPEVVVRRRGGELFGLDPSAFEKIKDEEVRMCAGIALSIVYPPHLVVVRKPDGTWESPY